MENKVEVSEEKEGVIKIEKGTDSKFNNGNNQGTSGGCSC
jgi:hypothetical protein